jgi:hypothetical protein
MLGQGAVTGKVAQLRWQPRTGISGNLSKFKRPCAALSFFEGYSATLQLVFFALVCVAIAIPSPPPRPDA